MTEALPDRVPGAHRQKVHAQRAPLIEQPRSLAGLCAVPRRRAWYTIRHLRNDRRADAENGRQRREGPTRQAGGAHSCAARGRGAGSSAAAYAMTARDATHSRNSRMSSLSIVSASVWWYQK